MRLTLEQTYAVARNAGFPPETARKMVAIAQRESGLNPAVRGTINAAKETSYGLWQINWKDAGIRALLIRNGITEPEMLYDPATNARAAALLWGGNDSNLNIAWYTDRVGLSYQQGEKYRANLAALPPADSFERAYTGAAASGDTVAEGGEPVPLDEFLTEIVGTDGNNNALLIAAGVLILGGALALA